jgi:hypothetical protein
VAENPKNQKSPTTTKIEMADGSPLILQRMRGALLWADGIVHGLWNEHFLLHDLHRAHPYDEWEIE